MNARVRSQGSGDLVLVTCRSRRSVEPTVMMLSLRGLSLVILRDS